MISLEDRHRLHQFLMLELAIRYVRMDLDAFGTMKCANVFVPFMENFLQHLIEQCQQEKQYFAQKQIRLIKWEKLDAYFSQVTIATAGEDAVFKYANQAVKTHVEEILKQQLK